MPPSLLEKPKTAKGVQHLRPFGKPWRKYLVKVGYSCNNYCTFCHTEDFRPMTDDDTKAVLGKIFRARELGAEMLVLTGGEPTIRKDLYSLTGAVHKLGMSLGLVTNGRLLSVPAAFEKLLGHGLAYTFISLHGATSATHNKLVVVNAFKETLGGIQAVSDYNRKQRSPAKGIDLTVNTVVTQQNVHELKAMVDLLRPLGPLQLKLSVVEPKGGGLHLYDKLALSPLESAEAIREAWQYAEETCPQGEVKVGIEGSTPCLLPGLPWVQDDLFTHGFVAMSETFEDRFFPVDHGKKHHPEICLSCGERDKCPGIPVDAAQSLFPIQALPKPLANSVNFFVSPTQKVESEVSCGLGLAPLPADSLWIRDNELFAKAVTQTNDFSPDQLTKVLKAGQVYSNLSKRFLGVQFDQDLQKLDLEPVCRTCSLTDNCSGAWCPGESSVFTKADLAVKDYLINIRGTVLEIGTGPDPYLSILKENLESGKMESYLGLEPGGYEHPLKNLSGVKVLKMPIEAYKSEEKFDHILLLRSLNHLYFPKEVLKTLSKNLKPGGEILLVENTEFFMVRSEKTKNKQPKGEEARKHLEHFHNLDSPEVVRWIQEIGMTVNQHLPITPQTANQWLITASI